MARTSIGDLATGPEPSTGPPARSHEVYDSNETCGRTGLPWPHSVAHYEVICSRFLFAEQIKLNNGGAGTCDCWGKKTTYGRSAENDGSLIRTKIKKVNQILASENRGKVLYYQ